MISISIEQDVKIYADGNLCGIYHYTDPFKSFFNPLFTPSGKNVLEPPTSGHPHHKGLQFGLCATAGNFWEESKLSEGAGDKYPIGKQRTVNIRLLDSGSGTGFQQDIAWEVEGITLFQECREISVTKEGNSYQWIWHTKLSALQNTDLIKTVWPPSPGYYGLGLRLSKDLFNNVHTTPNDITSGATPTAITLQGNDVAVTFEQSQTQNNALFVCCLPKDDFTFMSLGPTNNMRQPTLFEKGKILDCKYVVAVSDTLSSQNTRK